MSNPPQGGGVPPQGQYPGGSYMPPPDQVPGYGYGAPPPAQRSAIPKVIGILMIIFASLGLLFTLIGLGQSTHMPPGMDDKFTKALHSLQSWQSVMNIVGLLLGAFHLATGIQAVRYSRKAPAMAKLYGIIAIAIVLINVIGMFAWLMPMFDGAPSVIRTAFGVGLGFGAIFGSAWPIVVLALMSRPSAKEACVN